MRTRTGDANHTYWLVDLRSETIQSCLLHSATKLVCICCVCEQSRDRCLNLKFCCRLRCARHRSDSVDELSLSSSKVLSNVETHLNATQCGSL